MASVWFFLWGGALIVIALLLIPTYTLIQAQVAVYETAAQTATENNANYEDTVAQLTKANEQAVLLVKEARVTPLSDYIDLFDELAGAQIDVTEIIVSRSESGVSPVVIVGEARNRQALADFRDTLLANPAIESVALPLSNLAKDQDIPFTLDVTMDNSVSL